jgi:hypothetical protein
MAGFANLLRLLLDCPFVAFLLPRGIQYKSICQPPSSSSHFPHLCARANLCSPLNWLRNGIGFSPLLLSHSFIFICHCPWQLQFCLFSAFPLSSLLGPFILFSIRANSACRPSGGDQPLNSAANLAPNSLLCLRQKRPKSLWHYGPQFPAELAFDGFSKSEKEWRTLMTASLTSSADKILRNVDITFLNGPFPNNHFTKIKIVSPNSLNP